MAGDINFLAGATVCLAGRGRLALKMMGRRHRFAGCLAVKGGIILPAGWLAVKTMAGPLFLLLAGWLLGWLAVKQWLVTLFVLLAGWLAVKNSGWWRRFAGWLAGGLASFENDGWL